MDRMNKTLFAISMLVIVALISIMASMAFLYANNNPARANNEAHGLLEESLRAQYENTKLDFIAKTGRVVTHSDGTKEVVFDIPTLPGVEESKKMIEAATAAKDEDLLPLCSPEYLEYAKANNKRIEKASGDFWDAPGCIPIPGRIMIGPAGLPSESSANSTIDSDHVGYRYYGDIHDQGIYGLIHKVDQPVNNANDEGFGARFLAQETAGSITYWIEAGWIEGYWMGDTNQHVYSQKGTSTDGIWYWPTFDEYCGDVGEYVQTYLEAYSGTKWRSYCWDYDASQWHPMHTNWDLQDDDANTIEAYVEIWEDRIGEMPLTDVLFYNLQLWTDSQWDYWSTAMSGYTALSEQGGYQVFDNTQYNDFYVDN